MMFWVAIFCVVSLTVDCSVGNLNEDTVFDVRDIKRILTEHQQQIDTINKANAILVLRMNVMEEENRLMKSKLANVKCNVPEEELNLQTQPNDGPVKPTITTQSGSDDATMDEYGPDEHGQRKMTKRNAPGDSTLHLKQPHYIRSDIRTISGNQVGFYVTLRGLRGVSLGSHQTIPFDNVVTNVGNGYSKMNGIFSAPVDGIYSFTAIVRSYMNSEAHLIITKNGERIGNVYKGDQDRTATCTAVLVLNAGDHVYVQNTNASVTDLFGFDYSSFSGFLI
ncbi:uncharacterized protein LOC110446775 [Mizuhopecten yessoensis]|uniref:Cerebellin-3 n=1 Tax=Mizuhopecten yessoensis TaxID=6573 RepID=A0A210R6C7_MIZYE|nr:uncharacterized protein LOC110446775 [Mizuhopecten yessoensis]OWF56505.1 Cerebellin-3 [Mizuhopecten yessoensis]